MTAGKSFQTRYDTPCPALEAALHAQPIIWYFAAPFNCPLSFACATHMYTPVGGKAPSVPLGASSCSPWELQGAAPAQWGGAPVFVRPPVVCHFSGLCGWRVGAAVHRLAVRVARLVLWCRGVSSGAASWVSNNTHVLAGTSRRALGSVWRAHGPLRASCGGPEEKTTGQCRRPPSRSLTLSTFGAAENVSLAPFSQVTCAESAPAAQALYFPGGGARRSKWRTYPLILALEGNVLEDFWITFPW